MKTTPLTQVLTQITPLPRNADRKTLYEADEPFREIASADYSEAADPALEVAYLAHAANQLPALVATLTELLEVAEDLKASVDYVEGFSGPPAIFATTRELLRQATNVPTP